MPCLISYDTKCDVFNETGTSAGNLQKIGQFTFPTQVFVEGYNVASAVAANALVVLLIDNQDKNGTLKQFPLVNTVGMDQIDPTEGAFYIFPRDHGMIVNTTQAIGVYSYSAAALVAFQTTVIIYTRTTIGY